MTGVPVAGEIAGFGVDGLRAGAHVAGAQAVGDLVVLEEAGEALDLALVGGGEQDAGFLLDEGVDGVDERGDGAVEAHGGARVRSRFPRGRTVGVEDIDGSELVEVRAGVGLELVVQGPGGEVDILGADEVADAGALVALLDLVPPALALVLDHGGLFDEDAGPGAVGGGEEVEEGQVGGTGYGGEELPAGEDGGFAGTGGDVGLEFGGAFAAFELRGRRVPERVRRALMASRTRSVMGISVRGGAGRSRGRAGSAGSRGRTCGWTRSRRRRSRCAWGGLPSGE